MSNFNSTRHRGMNNEFVTRTQYSPPPPVAPVPLPVAAPKPVIDPASQDMVLFKGNYYTVKGLRAQRGPIISVEQKDLCTDPKIVAKASRELPEEVDNGHVVFAKYEGKYVVLIGINVALRAMVEDVAVPGKLLSNPTLKNALAQ